MQAEGGDSVHFICANKTTDRADIGYASGHISTGVRYSTSTVIRVSYSATPRANTLAKLGPINRQIIAVLTLRALSNSACVSIVASSRCNIIKVCVYLSIDIRSSLRLRSGVFGIQRSILSLVTVAVRQYNGARRK